MEVNLLIDYSRCEEIFTNVTKVEISGNNFLIHSEQLGSKVVNVVSMDNFLSLTYEENGLTCKYVKGN